MILEVENLVSGYGESLIVNDVSISVEKSELVAIIGLPDVDRPGSEIVKAVVQLKEGIQPSDNIKENLKKYASDHLSKYENPKIWEFREAMPLTAVGKVLKRSLRDEAKKSN